MALPRLKFVASPNKSTRRDKVRLIVVHDCEGSYLGSVSWFAMTRSQVSAHLVLRDDGLEATQMVDWDVKAWHACDANSYSEGIEAAGYSAKGLGAAEWEALAAIVAFRLHANGIVCQVATAANGWTGFCQHADLGAMGGGHHDITSSPSVWAAFVKLVQAAHAMPQPTSWSGEAAIIAPKPPVDFKPCGDVRHGFPEGSIEWAQAALNAIDNADLVVDNKVGPATKSAVRDFQFTAKIGVDGLIGPATISALKLSLASH